MRATQFTLNEAKSIEFLGSYDADRTEWPDTTVPEVALLGRSNVGKSSMLNLLFGETAARVSKTPGRTQRLNLFSAKNSRDQNVLTVADLPGYGYAKISKEDEVVIQNMLRSYLSGRKQLRLLILLVDGRRGPLEVDASIIGYVAEHPEMNFKVCVVSTKVDKLKPAEADINVRAIRDAFGLPDGQPVRFSAVTGEGKNDVWGFMQQVAAE